MEHSESEKLNDFPDPDVTADKWVIQDSDPGILSAEPEGRHCHPVLEQFAHSSEYRENANFLPNWCYWENSNLFQLHKYKLRQDKIEVN